MGRIVILSLLFSLPPLSMGAADPTEHHSKYAGQEQRAIKSLSADDIRQLRQGEGWGLAKAAELNGMPGPAHLLQMKDKIDLTETQEAAIRRLFEDMRQKAIPLGHRLIEQERALNQGFATRTITAQTLERQLQAIADTRRALRQVHLAAHLATPNILTAQQIHRYNALRGYTDTDPCTHVPEGHDPVMWREHNNCP